MTAVANFPWTLDRGPLDRLRRPLAAIAGIILAVDLIGLGLHLADAVDNPIASDEPTQAKTRIVAPDAVVPNGSVFGARTDRQTASGTRPAVPQGCLALDSGCYPGGSGTGPGTTPPPGNSPTAPPPPAGPVPIAQADLAVPALGAQVSLGLGEGSCTSVALTALALGDCPIASQDGPVVLNLGGSLVGD